MPVNNSADGWRSQKRDEYWRLSAPEFFARCHLITTSFSKNLKTSYYAPHDPNFISNLFPRPIFGSRDLCQMPVNNNADGWRSQKRDEYWKWSTAEFFARFDLITTSSSKNLKTNYYAQKDPNFISNLFPWPIFGSRDLCQMPVNNSADGLRSQKRDKKWRLSAPEFFARCHLITTSFSKN